MHKNFSIIKTKLLLIFCLVFAFFLLPAAEVYALESCIKSGLGWNTPGECSISLVYSDTIPGSGLDYCVYRIGNKIDEDNYDMPADFDICGDCMEQTMFECEVVMEIGDGKACKTLGAEACKIEVRAGDIAGNATTFSQTYSVAAYSLDVSSIPVDNIPIGSTTGHGENTNYRIENIPPGTDVSLAAPLSHGIYSFIGWSGHCSGDNPCKLTILDGDKAVVANYSVGPTAIIGCDPYDCGGGPGCVCDDSEPVWATYHGASFDILNDSSFPDPGSLYTSTWNVTSVDYSDEKECTVLGGGCDYGNIAALSADTYTVELEVVDGDGLSNTAQKQVIVKNDVFADFKCSLDGGVTELDCGGLTILSTEDIYFKDKSRPSDGMFINTWTWQKKAEEDPAFSDFYIYFNNIETIGPFNFDGGQYQIRLIVRDSTPGGGRTASTIRSINVRQLPLPKYIEVTPY